MVKNRTIQIRLTRSQYEQVRHNAALKGFSTLSSYLRFMALEQDFTTQQKIHDIHHFLIGPSRSKKRKATS